MVTLTPSEIAALNAEYCRLQNSVATRTAQLAAQVDIIAAATDTDNAEKKAFDFYDIDIIRKYEDEREALDGTYVENPVVKSELDAVGQLDATQRLFPTNPVTEPIRIAEFDGGGLITTDNQIPGVPSDPLTPSQLDIEPYWISKQAEREDWLVNGFGGTSPTVTPTMSVAGPVTPATTQITIESSALTEAFNFQVGDTFVIDDGSNQVGVLVTNVVSQNNGDPLAGFCTGEDNPPQTDQASCEADNGVWTADPQDPEAVLDILVLTTSSVSTGGDLDSSWAGFSNTDRTNKVDATDGYTNLLLELIDDLENMIDNRIDKLTDQQTALTANQDPSLDASALTNVNTALTALNDWKVDKDVDDTELGVLASERATRSPQITARIAAIEPAKAVYYNDRYTSAVNIADTSRGTARIKFFRINTGGPGGTIENLKTQEENRIQAIEDLLTLAGEPIPTC